MTAAATPETEAGLDLASFDLNAHRLYIGRRFPPPVAGARGMTEVVVLQAGKERPLTHHVHHSPDGYEWGFEGSGPAELARDLLWDHLDCEPPPALYQLFKSQIVVALRYEGWEITTAQLSSWLGEHLVSEVRR